MLERDIVTAIRKYLASLGSAVFFWKEVCSRLQLISGPTRWRLGKALSRQWRNALTMGLIRKSWEPCPHTSAIRPRLPLSFCW